MRKTFDAELQELNYEMIDMAAAAEDAIDVVTESLASGDDEAAKSAVEVTRHMDEMERDIENRCLQLLLRQQPVARDLREISSALKMISDLERIGDQAADIAELTRFVRLPDGPGRQRIEEMAKAVIRMVTDSVDSFVKRDLELAR